MEIINGSDNYFKYTFDVKKQEESDSVFVVNADLEQLVLLDNNWKVNMTKHYDRCVRIVQIFLFSAV